MIAITPFYYSSLPWSSGEAENKRFAQIASGSIVLTVVFASWMSLIEVPQQTREEKAKIPPQLAKLLEAEQPSLVELPEPEPVIVEPVDPVEDVPKETPITEPEPIEPEPMPEPVEVKPQAIPAPPPEMTQEEKVLQAKETAASAGVMAFTDDLASLRDDLNLNNLADTQLTEGAGQQAETSRKLIGQQLDTTSGGIDTSTLSSTVGARGQLEGRKTTEFNAPTQGAAALATQRIETETQIIGDRSLESIRQVIDRNKGGIYSLYRRALREEPDLQGKLTVKLTILPSGQLESVDLINSDLGTSALVERLLARIKLINFGRQDVQPTQLEYTFNFLPF